MALGVRGIIDTQGDKTLRVNQWLRTLILLRNSELRID